jgi:D-hexose-6-phosphate mutarotase
VVIACAKPDRGNLVAIVQVTVGPDYLIQEMRVTNTGSNDLTFTSALHTYFRVKNIDKARWEHSVNTSLA